MTDSSTHSVLSVEASLGKITHIGVDVISTQRLSRVLTRSPKLFHRLCQRQERADLCSPHQEGLVWATLLWTSKEAAAKCLQTGFWRSGIDWPDLEIRVINDDQDQSYIDLSQDSVKSLSEQIRSELGVKVKVRSHRAAADLLGSDQIFGRFMIKDEMGICLMHRASMTVFSHDG